MDILRAVNRHIKKLNKMIITSKDNKLKKQISREISRLTGIRNKYRKKRKR